MALFYVSAAGSDLDNGLGLATAFATVERAQDAMRQSAGADTTFIRGGTYQVGAGLSLTEQDNGSSFAAYGAEVPTLSGGTALTQWTKGANGIWTAHLAQADLHQLTLDGVSQTEARFPNAVADDPIKGGWLWAKAPPSGVDPQTQMAYTASDLAGGKIAVGMKVHLFTDASWASNTRVITAIDTVHGVMTFDGATNFPLGAATRYYVEDAKVHLDQVGEWWFDTASQTVNYKAPPGFDGKGVVASGLHNVVEVVGARDIKIAGLSFSDATTANGEDGTDGSGILVARSAGISITGNSFVNLTQGVHVADQSRDTVIADNHFTHTAGSGINLDYDTSKSTVTGNDLRWTNEAFAFPGAIQMDETRDNLIAHNLIRDVPRVGIQVDHSNPNLVSGNNIIEYNTVLRSMQQTSDAGAIYIWSGTDRVALGDTVRFNRIMDAGGVQTETGKFLPEQEYSNGVYLDDYTSRAKVYGNMIEGTVRGGIYMHGGSFNSVHDNIVLGNKDIGIQFYEIAEKMQGNDVFHNIVQATTDPAGNTVELNPAFVASGSLHDNFYWNTTGQVLNFSNATFAAWQALGYDKGSAVFSSALFGGPTAGDWSLCPDAFPLSHGFIAPPLTAMASFGTGMIVLGSGAADSLSGTSGNDVLDGFGGNDRLYGFAGADDLSGGAGADSLYGGDGADHGFGGAGRDVLFGGAGDDQLFGDADADRLTGDSGNDRLWGGTGNDTLTGGLGVDIMAGGLGADVFYFKTAAESGTTPATTDRIVDFEDGIDRISLGSIDANSTKTGNEAFHLSGASAFDGQAGELLITQMSGDTFVVGDLNGDRAADFIIQLDGLHVLTAADFLL